MHSVVSVFDSVKYFSAGGGTLGGNETIVGSTPAPAIKDTFKEFLRLAPVVFVLYLFLSFSILFFLL